MLETAGSCWKRRVRFQSGRLAFEVVGLRSRRRARVANGFAFEMAGGGFDVEGRGAKGAGITKPIGK